MLEIFQTLFAPPRHLILLLVSAWLGLGLAERQAPRHGIDREVLGNMIFYALLAYLAGGRLLYAASNLPAFLASPASLFSPNTHLFDRLGAAAAGIGAAWFLGRRKHLPLWATLDALTPFMAALAIGTGLAHMAEGTAYGRLADVPWAIELWNARRHPSQVYETLAALIILGIALVQRSARAGHLFLTFAALSAAARLFLEAYRGDSQMLRGGIRLAQVGAWLVLLALFVFLEMRNMDRGGFASRPEEKGPEQPGNTTASPY